MVDIKGALNGVVGYLNKSNYDQAYKALKQIRSLLMAELFALNQKHPFSACPNISKQLLKDALEMKNNSPIFFKSIESGTLTLLFKYLVYSGSMYQGKREFLKSKKRLERAISMGLSSTLAHLGLVKLYEIWDSAISKDDCAEIANITTNIKSSICLKLYKLESQLALMRVVSKDVLTFKKTMDKVLTTLTEINGVKEIIPSDTIGTMGSVVFLMRELVIDLKFVDRGNSGTINLDFDYAPCNDFLNNHHACMCHNSIYFGLLANHLCVCKQTIDKQPDHAVDYQYGRLVQLLEYIVNSFSSMLVSNYQDTSSVTKNKGNGAVLDKHVSVLKKIGEYAINPIVSVYMLVYLMHNYSFYSSNTVFTVSNSRISNIPHLLASSYDRLATTIKDADQTSYEFYQLFMKFYQTMSYSIQDPEVQKTHHHVLDKLVSMLGNSITSVFTSFYDWKLILFVVITHLKNYRLAICLANEYERILKLKVISNNAIMNTIDIHLTYMRVFKVKATLLLLSNIEDAKLFNGLSQFPCLNDHLKESHRGICNLENTNLNICQMTSTYNVQENTEGDTHAILDDSVDNNYSSRNYIISCLGSEIVDLIGKYPENQDIIEIQILLLSLHEEEVGSDAKAVEAANLCKQLTTKHNFKSNNTDLEYQSYVYYTQGLLELRLNHLQDADKYFLLSQTTSIALEESEKALVNPDELDGATSKSTNAPISLPFLLQSGRFSMFHSGMHLVNIAVKEDKPIDLIIDMLLILIGNNVSNPEIYMFLGQIYQYRYSDSESASKCYKIGFDMYLNMYPTLHKQGDLYSHTYFHMIGLGIDNNIGNNYSLNPSPSLNMYFPKSFPLPIYFSPFLDVKCAINANISSAQFTSVYNLDANPQFQNRNNNSVIYLHNSLPMFMSSMTLQLNTLYLHSGNTKLAIMQCSDILTTCHYPWAYYRRALLYKHDNKPNQAIICYQNFIKRHAHGHHLHQFPNKNDKINQADKILPIDSIIQLQNTEFNQMLLSRKIDLSSQLLLNFESLSNCSCVYVYLAIADAYLDLGKCVSAEKILAHVLTLVSNMSMDLYFNITLRIGLASLLLGKPEEAMKHLDLSYLINPELSNSFDIHGDSDRIPNDFTVAQLKDHLLSNLNQYKVLFSSSAVVYFEKMKNNIEEGRMVAAKENVSMAICILLTPMTNSNFVTKWQDNANLERFNKPNSCSMIGFKRLPSGPNSNGTYELIYLLAQICEYASQKLVDLTMSELIISLITQSELGIIGFWPDHHNPYQLLSLIMYKLCAENCSTRDELCLLSCKIANISALLYDFSTALDYGKQAVSLNPTQSITWHQLGLAYFYAINRYSEIKQNVKFFNTITVANIINPGVLDIDKIDSTIQEYSQMYQYCLSKAIQYNPKNANYYCNLGFFYLTFYSKKHINPAFMSFIEAQKVNTEQVQVWLGLAMTAELFKKQEHIELFRHAGETATSHCAAIGFAKSTFHLLKKGMTAINNNNKFDYHQLRIHSQYESQESENTSMNSKKSGVIGVNNKFSPIESRTLISCIQGLETCIRTSAASSYVYNMYGLLLESNGQFSSARDAYTEAFAKLCREWENFSEHIISKSQFSEREDMSVIQHPINKTRIEDYIDNANKDAEIESIAFKAETHKKILTVSINLARVSNLCNSYDFVIDLITQRLSDLTIDYSTSLELTTELAMAYYSSGSLKQSIVAYEQVKTKALTVTGSDQQLNHNGVNYMRDAEIAQCVTLYTKGEVKKTKDLLLKCYNSYNRDSALLNILCAILLSAGTINNELVTKVFSFEQDTKKISQSKFSTNYKVQLNHAILQVAFNIITTSKTESAIFAPLSQHVLKNSYTNADPNFWILLCKLLMNYAPNKLSGLTLALKDALRQHHKLTSKEKGEILNLLSISCMYNGKNDLQGNALIGDSMLDVEMYRRNLGVAHTYAQKAILIDPFSLTSYSSLITIQTNYIQSSLATHVYPLLSTSDPHFKETDTDFNSILRKSLAYSSINVSKLQYLSDLIDIQIEELIARERNLILLAHGKETLNEMKLWTVKSLCDNLYYKLILDMAFKKLEQPMSTPVYVDQTGKEYLKIRTLTKNLMALEQVSIEMFAIGSICMARVLLLPSNSFMKFRPTIFNLYKKTINLLLSHKIPVQDLIHELNDVYKYNGMTNSSNKLWQAIPPVHII